MLTVREALALLIAVAADAVQWLVLPLFAEGGFSPADAGLDAAAFAVLTGLLGFSPLLLPTVVVELLPVADLAPAWTVAVVAIIWRRRSAQRKAAAIKVTEPAGAVAEGGAKITHETLP
ncbi:MAG: hypothetical protein H0X38_12370 [Planctomycetes bacterium]|nr:hypothetical protein [Planctomycetota bacterium]